MDLKLLQEVPPWEWPENTAEVLLGILLDGQASESDRVLAAELAGEYGIINDDLAQALLSNLTDRNKSEDVRSRAAISLGPVLEQGDTEGFEDVDEVPISERTFDSIQATLQSSTRTRMFPRRCAAAPWRRRCARRRSGIAMQSAPRTRATRRTGSSRACSACASFAGSTSRSSTR